STAPPATATSSLSLHDALPIFPDVALFVGARGAVGVRPVQDGFVGLARERAFFYFRIGDAEETAAAPVERELVLAEILRIIRREDRKSTRLNSSHRTISYAVFC